MTATYNTSLSGLIPRAFQILSDTYVKLGELAVEAIDLVGSPRQPIVEDQLMNSATTFDVIMRHVILNDDGTEIIGIVGQNVNTINQLLLELREIAEINQPSSVPAPLNTIIFNPSDSPVFNFGSLSSGDLMYYTGIDWSNFAKGSDGQVLVSTPIGIQWQNVVGNGIPSGGTTGQYLRKSSNTSFAVVWDTLTLSKITDVTASASEVNVLDGALMSTAELNDLVGVTSPIQTQFLGKLSTSLTNGRFLVGNGSNIATAVSPTGDVTFNNTGLFDITAGSIINADINATAAISRSKLAAGVANRVLINNGAGALTDAAAITANRLLVSNSSGIPIASATTDIQAGFLSTLTSNVQDQLNSKLTVSLTSVTQGDLITNNGSNWINLAIGTAGQVLTTDGTSVMWGSAAANGLPIGGTTGQFLIKNSNTNYDAGWTTFVLADVTDVSTTNTELNLLSGLTVNSSVLNFSSGLFSNIQGQLNNLLTNNLAYHAIYVGGAGNTAIQVGPGAEGSVLTVVSGHPTWQSPPTPGDVSGPVSSTDNAISRWNGTAGDSIQNSGVIIDDSNNISGIASLTVVPGGSLRTNTSAGNTLLLQAYDVDGTAYTTFATLTANNTPTMDLSTSVTIGGAAIYRVGGTDVSLADGGTGASLSDPGANTLLGWDDTDNATVFITLGTGLTYTHSTHTLSVSAAGTGDVVGPSSSTDNAITRFDSTTGKLIQNSVGILDDSGNLSGIASLTINTTGSIRTATSAGNTLLFQAYDVDGTSYTTFATLTANNTPTFDLASGVTIGGASIYRVGGTDVALSDGGTGTTLSDPGADRLWGWDDTDNAIKFITIGTNLSYDHSTHTLSATGGGGSVTDANNGLSLDSTTVILGGNPLNQPTTINTDTTNFLKITEVGSYYAKFGDVGGSGIIEFFVQSGAASTLDYITELTKTSTVQNATDLSSTILGSKSYEIAVSNTNGETHFAIQHDTASPVFVIASTHPDFRGMEYDIDYSSTFVDRSIPDVGFVNTAIASAISGSGFVASVSGTTNRITSTGGATPVIDISASYVGQASITTVGTLTTGATGSGFTIALASSTITGDLAFSNLTQIAGLSVLGVTGTSTADVTAITGTTDLILRVNSAGTGLGFGTVATGGIANSAVTYAKIQDATAGLSILGRSTNSTGVLADITAGTDAFVLRRSGTSIGFGTIGDASISALAFSKLTSTPTTLAGYGITDAFSNPMTSVGDLIQGSTAGAPVRLAAVATGNVLISGGVTTTSSWGKVTSSHIDSSVATIASPTFTGTPAAPTAANGTNTTQIATTAFVLANSLSNPMTNIGDLIQGSTSGTPVRLASVAAGSFLRSGGVTTASVWSTTVWTNSATVGDILQATSANTYTNLASVATGNALISGGVTTANSWGKIGLTTHVSGTLPETSGGTNQTTYTTGDILYASASNTLSKLADVAVGSTLNSGGVTTAPGWATVSNGLTATATTFKLGGALTGVTTLTSNTANQWVLDGTWTSTANSQFHFSSNPSLTARGTASDTLTHFQLRPTLIAGANTQKLIVLDLDATFTVGSFTGTDTRYVSSTNWVVQSTGSQLFGSNLQAAIGSAGASGFNVAGQQIRLEGRVNATTDVGIQLSSQNATTALTSGSAIHTRIGGLGFNPTTGSASIKFFSIENSVNQTSSASGAVTIASITTTLTSVLGTLTGLIYNPAITTVTGTHFGFVCVPTGALSGVGTSTPNLTWDINGGFGIRQQTITQLVANTNNWAVGAQTSFRFSTDASRNITGITGGTDGKILVLTNVGSQNAVFTNEDSNSTAANRITTSTGGNLTVAGNGTVTLQYDATTSRWRDISIR